MFSDFLCPYLFLTHAHMCARPKAVGRDVASLFFFLLTFLCFCNLIFVPLTFFVFFLLFLLFSFCQTASRDIASLAFFNFFNFFVFCLTVGRDAGSFAALHALRVGGVRFSFVECV